MINIFEKIYLKILLFKDKKKDNNCLYYIILNTLNKDNNLIIYCIIYESLS